MQNIFLSHAHKAKSADYGRVAHDGVVCVSYIHGGVVSHCDRSVDNRNQRVLFTHRVIETNSLIVCWHWLGSIPIN